MTPESSIGGDSVDEGAGRSEPGLTGVPQPEFIDLGRMPYAQALALQRRTLDEAVAARDQSGWKGRVFLVEHDPPVITVTRRPGVAGHLLASQDFLAARGIELHETDRGGDITYHGPGQLVVYPILDLNELGLRIHGYMRFLEEVVIRTLTGFGVVGWRDGAATGVWVGGETTEEGTPTGGAKICALGVRVSRWITMHGLALNVDPDLAHFQTIVPCGLHGRTVTSLARELGPQAPEMAEVKAALTRQFLLAATEASRSLRRESSGADSDQPHPPGRTAAS